MSQYESRSYEVINAIMSPAMKEPLNKRGSSSPCYLINFYLLQFQLFMQRCIQSTASVHLFRNAALLLNYFSQLQTWQQCNVFTSRSSKHESGDECCSGIFYTFQARNERYLFIIFRAVIL